MGMGSACSHLHQSQNCNLRLVFKNLFQHLRVARSVNCLCLIAKFWNKSQSPSVQIPKRNERKNLKETKQKTKQQQTKESLDGYLEDLLFNQEIAAWPIARLKVFILFLSTENNMVLRVSPYFDYQLNKTRRKFGDEVLAL